MSHYLKDELYQSIQDSPVLFDFIQEAALDGLWYWDLERPEYEWLSPKFWQLLGFDPSEKQHLASEWQHLINPDDLAAAKTNLEMHIADPRHPYDQIVRYTHRDGSTVWVRCRGMAIRDEDGRAIRMLGAHNDITELKLAEAALRAADKVKSQFLANMSHELKTPLNGVLGLAHLAMRESDMDKVRDKLEKIEASGQQLLKMVNDLLLFNKIEADLLSVNASEFVLEELLASVHSAFKADAMRKGLSFRLLSEFELNRVLVGDAELINQVLVRLVSNAIKFTEQGEITLGVCQFTQGEQSYYQFDVVDTGCGLTKDEQDQLFKPFMQSDASHTRAHEGVGLGLVICHRIVKKLGGEGIEVESQTQQGSRFGFALPLAEVSMADGKSIEATTGSVSVKPKQLNVLVVNDNYINRELTGEILRQQGFQVALAEDNAEALAKIQQQNIDLVFIDFFYQKLNGFDSILNWKEFNANLVVIGMVTEGDEYLQDGRLPEAINDIVTTPLTETVINELFRRLNSTR